MPMQEFSMTVVYAKPCLSQVNVEQNLSATGRNFGFTCNNDMYFFSLKFYQIKYI